MIVLFPTLSSKTTAETSRSILRIPCRQHAHRFVGRTRDVGELRGALQAAARARGRLVFVGGEPGIGKTRLVSELAEYVQARRSALVLRSTCWEGDGASAFWPWVQLIRGYSRLVDPEQLRQDIGSGAADVAQLVPEALPGFTVAAQPEAGADRVRLFDAITTFWRTASVRLPLIVDDLHWGDTSSLLLLRYLGQQLRGARLLVLGT